MDYKKDIINYFQNVKDTLDKISVEDLNTLLNLLNKARDENRFVFICGNGGSASTASHFCCDFNKGISSDQKSKFRFVCLSDNIPTLMAYANDYSWEEIFVGPLRNLFHEGDFVIGISGSGNSSNVIKALQYANEHQGISIGLTGYDGGIVKKISQYNVHVPIRDMQVSEDLHLLLDHCMMSILCKHGENR
jgi:D-sedoheptulose 7-phosphate isomerase